MWSCTCAFGLGKLVEDGLVCKFCRKACQTIVETLPSIETVVIEETNQADKVAKGLSSNEADVIEDLTDTEDTVTVTTVVTTSNPDVIEPDAKVLFNSDAERKKAELEAYKFYANEESPRIDDLIKKHGEDSGSILDAIESRILYFQKQQYIFRTWEQTARLRKAQFVQTRNLENVEKKRKSDLNYVPTKPGEVSTVVRKTVVKASKSRLSQTEKLIADLVAKGLSEKEAKKLLGV